MDLKIPYTHLTSADEAYNLAKELITPEYISKWKVKAEVNMDDVQKKIVATGKGFTLNLTFAETEAQVECDLSFMLKAFKKTILEAVEAKLKKHI